MDKRYFLDSSKTAIIDINVSEFTDNTIVFPSEVDGNKITSIGLEKETLAKLCAEYGEFNVIIEDGIKDIKEKMFVYSNIRSVSIPPSIETISSHCFCDSGLKEVIFSGENCIKTIGRFAFGYCKQLPSFSFPKSIEKIKDNAFRGSGLKEINFPNAEEQVSIGELAFAECSSLKTVVFPFSTSINFGRSTFYQCESLETANMFNVDTETLPAGMFSGCRNLKFAAIPKVVAMIGERAFYGCTNLTTVWLSKSRVREIVNDAFEDCLSYSDGVFPDTIEKIGSRAFMKCNIDALRLPTYTLKKVGNHAFANNPFAKGIDLAPFAACKSIGDYIFTGASVKSVHLIPLIGENVSGTFMFSSCTELKEVTMDAGAELYEGMFCGCNKLSSVSLSDSVTAIPAFAFMRCKELNEMEFPETITKIGTSAFELSNIKEVDLSKSEKVKICPSAFAYTSVSSIKLPTYGCAICKSSFREEFMDDVLEENPFITVID